jgi:hypothetical protein
VIYYPDFSHPAWNRIDRSLSGKCLVHLGLVKLRSLELSIDPIAKEAAMYMCQHWESESHKGNAFDLRGNEVWCTGDAEVGYLDVASPLSKYGDLDIDSGPMNAA